MPEEIQSLLREAENARSQKDWDMAIDKYKAVAEIDPQNEEACSKLAEIYAIRGLISNVIEQYFNLMDILEQKEEYDLAVEVARWIMKLEPESDKARMKTILIYKKKGDMDEVVKQSLQLARLYIELGQGDQSILLLKNAQEIAPDNLDIGLELAEMYISHGHIQEGTNQYRKIANAYLTQQNFEKAAEAFRRMKIVTPEDPQLSFTLGNLYMKLGRLDEAENEFRAILRHNLNHTEALMALGNVCQKKGQFRDAILAFNKILSVNPQDVVAKEKLGELYQAQGATNEAVKHYLQAANIYQHEFDEEVDRAIKLYQRVLTIDPTNPTACRELTNLGAPLVADEGEKEEEEVPITPLEIEEEFEAGPSLEEMAGAILPEDVEIPEEASLEELAGEGLKSESPTPESEPSVSGAVPSAFSREGADLEEFKQDVGSDLVFSGEEESELTLEAEAAEYEEAKEVEEVYEEESEEVKGEARTTGGFRRRLRRKDGRSGGGLLRKGLSRKDGVPKRTSGGLRPSGVLSAHGRTLSRRGGKKWEGKPSLGLFRRRSKKKTTEEVVEEEVREPTLAAPHIDQEGLEAAAREEPGFVDEDFQAVPGEQEMEMYEELAPPMEEFEAEAPPMEKFAAEAPPVEEFAEEAPSAPIGEFEEEAAPYEEFPAEAPPEAEFEMETLPEEEFAAEMPPMEGVEEMALPEAEYTGEAPPMEEYPELKAAAPSEFEEEVEPLAPEPGEYPEFEEAEVPQAELEEAQIPEPEFEEPEVKPPSRLIRGKKKPLGRLLGKKKKPLKSSFEPEYEEYEEIKMEAEPGPMVEEEPVPEEYAIEEAAAPEAELPEMEGEELEFEVQPEIPEMEGVPEMAEIPEMPESAIPPEFEEIPQLGEAELPPVETPPGEISISEEEPPPMEAEMPEEMDMDIPELELGEAEMAESLEGIGEMEETGIPEMPEISETGEPFAVEVPGEEEIELPTIGVGPSREIEESAFESEEEMDMTIPDLTSEGGFGDLGDIEMDTGGGLGDFADLLKLAEDIESILPDEERIKQAEEEKVEKEETTETQPEVSELAVSTSTMPELPGEGSEVTLTEMGEPQPTEEEEADTSELPEGQTIAPTTSFLPPLELPEEKKTHTEVLEEIEAPPEIEIEEEEVKAEVVEEVPVPAPELEPDLEEKIHEMVSEGNLGEAFSLYKKALEKSTDNEELRREYADLCYNYGLVDEALETYQQILENEPKNYELRKKMIRVQLIYDRIDSATATLVDYGNELTSEDQIDDAQRMFQYALALKKENPEARESLSEIYLNQDMKQLALYHLNILAEYLEKQESIDRTIKVLKKIFSLTSDINTQEKLAEVYINHDYKPEAIIELQSLAERYMENEEFLKAAKHYEKIVEVDPKNIEAHNRMIVLFGKLGDKERSYQEKVIVADLLIEKESFKDARVRLEDCLKIKNYDHDVRRKLIDVYLKLGDVERAREESRVLSEVYHKERRYNEAIELYLEMINYSPRDLSLREKLSEFYIMTDQYSKGLEQLLLVAEEQEQQEQWDDAIKTYRKTLSIDERNADIHFSIGEIFYKHKNNITEARYEFDKVYQIDPTHRKAMEHLVNLYLQEDKPAKAIGVLRRLIELDDSYASMKDKIIQNYKSKIEEDPKNLQAHFNLGIVYKELSMWKQAIEQFQTTRKSRDFVLESHNMLGMCFAQQPPMLNLAIKTLEKGLKLKGFEDKDYIELHYNLGRLYERMDKYDKACDEYQAVMAIDPHFRDTADLLKQAKRKSSGK